MLAILGGTVLQPRLFLRFGFDAVHATTGQPLRDWVKELPDRRWNRKLNGWTVDGIGPDPFAQLIAAGFALDATSAVADLAGLPPAALVAPVLRADARNAEKVEILPRLTGSAVVIDWAGPSASFDRGAGIVRCGLASARTLAESGTVIIGNGVADLLARTRPESGDAAACAAEGELATSVRTIALSAGSTSDSRQSAEAVAHAVGDIPTWFGGEAIHLFDYQRGGALAMVAGRRFLADEMGVGKSYTALAAAAMLCCRRILIVVPPVMLTDWAKSADTAGMGINLDRPKAEKVAARYPAGSPAADGAHVYTIRRGRRLRRLPERGLVVVSDELVKARPGLFEALTGWRPDCLIYDEAHRARGDGTVRSEIMQALASQLGDRPRFALTGTPMLSGSPADMLPLLRITGQIDGLGGDDAYLTRYCRRDKWDKWEGRKSELVHLRQQLDDRIWVRRRKADVLPDLPIKNWARRYVDVDLTAYHAAHRDVIDKIIDWIAGFDHDAARMPSEGEAEVWCRSKVGLISPLRRAAGMAKTDVAAEWIIERLNSIDRPLLVWAHHRDVIAAVAQALDDAEVASRPDTGIIDGSTSQQQRARLTEAFQDHRLRVLICQITAAGVGLTLTAANEALFVETDWIADLVTQAEDRLNRVSQTEPCFYTTLFAEGTLDDRIEQVRAGKAVDASPITGYAGGTSAVVGVDGSLSVDGAGSPPWEVAFQLFAEARDQYLQQRQRPRDRIDAV